MLAAIKDGPGPGITVRDVPDPIPASGEVVVRVRAVGICGSDLPIISGVRPVAYPLIPGHEFAGEVEALGPDVSGWSVGDRVTALLVIGCGRCEYCRRGLENLCVSISEIGIHQDGAYAERVAVPATCLYRLPEGMTFIEGASVDPVASVYRGIRLHRTGPDDDVVVIGAGPVGLYAVQAVQARGCRSVAVLVRHEDRRSELARELGARVIVDEAASSDEAVRASFQGRRPTLVIEASGNPVALERAITFAAPSSTILLVGVFHAAAPIAPGPIVRKELKIQGTLCHSPDDFRASIDLIASGSVRPVHSHVLPLAAIQRGLDSIERREAVKVVLQP